MPTRANAIILCSCTQKFGSLSRAAASEEAADVERGVLAADVPRMIRHHELGHRLALGENAPRSFLAVVAEVARRVAVARERGLPEG